MDFLSLVQDRYSCRKFSSDPVEKEKLLSIIEAARLAPSAVNAQPWMFYAAESEKELLAVKKASQQSGMNKFTDNAPIIIAVVETKSNLVSKIGGKIKGHNFPQIDIGIATAHLTLQAKALGLDTCILGWFDEKAVKEALNVKKSHRVHLLVALGYGEKRERKEKKRKSAEEIFKLV